MQKPVAPSRVFLIDDICGHLRISKRTLMGWLKADEKREDPKLQHHHYRGRERAWTETEFLALEAAIKQESLPGGVLAASRSLSATGRGTSTARSRLQMAIRNALEKVRAFQPGPLRAPPPKKR